MRDPTEQLYRIQNAIIKITEYVNKGRRRFDVEEETQQFKQSLTQNHS